MVRPRDAEAEHRRRRAEPGERLEQREADCLQLGEAVLADGVEREGRVRGELGEDLDEGALARPAGDVDGPRPYEGVDHPRLGTSAAVLVRHLGGDVPEVLEVTLAERAEDAFTIPEVVLHGGVVALL